MGRIPRVKLLYCNSPPVERMPVPRARRTPVRMNDPLTACRVRHWRVWSYWIGMTSHWKAAMWWFWVDLRSSASRWRCCASIAMRQSLCVTPVRWTWRVISAKADIVIAAIGVREFVQAEWPGATVVDVGINGVPDASKKCGYRLVGDVAYDEAMWRKPLRLCLEV